MVMSSSLLLHYKNPTFLTTFSRHPNKFFLCSMMRSLVDFKAIKKILTRRRRRLNFSLQITGASDTDIPADVKEGHFVVRTFDNGGEMKRFILKLGYLAHPGFLKLLEQAEEEFGFQQQGALAVPCGPGELQKILFGDRICVVH